VVRGGWVLALRDHGFELDEGAQGLDGVELYVVVEEEVTVSLYDDLDSFGRGKGVGQVGRAWDGDEVVAALLFA
jgi:hypothetical protein